MPVRQRDKHSSLSQGSLDKNWGQQRLNWRCFADCPIAWFILRCRNQNVCQRLVQLQPWHVLCGICKLSRPLSACLFIYHLIAKFSYCLICLEDRRHKEIEYNRKENAHDNKQEPAIFKYLGRNKQDEWRIDETPAKGEIWTGKKRKKKFRIALQILTFIFSLHAQGPDLDTVMG